MFLFTILLSWTLSMIFMGLKHPLSFGFILLLQTIIISTSSSIMNFDYWFSYILFLIMIGGLLILFIYMTSIASNEKFKFSFKLLLFVSLALIALFLISLMMDKLLILLNMHTYDLVNQSIYNLNLSMNKYMNFPSMLMTILLMIYLLITLIAIVKMTQSNLGPLRQTL
uniref:NADH-ubiquinone oxidoreductase chain 6 n=1 Tax=Dichotrachelus manueli TaxID=1315750 RepID=A0A3G2JZH1_9CUCU|nr:NADH dehydrogenase subunit 6 [Dichotrachelus manueli]